MSTIPVVHQPGQDHVRRAFKSVRKSRLWLLFIVAITFLMPALMPALSTLRGLNAGRVDASTGTAPGMTSAVMPAPAPPPSDDQIMSFAYFIEQGDMSSTLRLNNNLPDPIAATVTVFNSRGESFTAPPLMLPPQDVQGFRIAELMANVPGDFHSGSVQVFYHGPAMAVTGQVSVASASSRLIFESFPTMSMGFASARLDGIVWIPDAGAQASAALTNTTTDMLTVTIGTATNLKSLTLNAHETNLVDLKEFLINRQDVGAALVRIEHNGTPGAVIVTGFAMNEKTGFSCNLPFVDRATAKTAHLAGAHVRFGKPDGKEGFFAATRFNAPLLVANAGDQPSEARVFVDYTMGGVAGRAELAKLKLAPQQVRQVELSSAMARFGVVGPVEDAGIDITYSGSPGAVIARLTSLDRSGDLAYDVPIKDPLAELMRVGGSYPWRLDGGFTTVLHLKNTINKPVFALVQVRYAGGSYNLERLPLEPFQTIAVDLRALRDDQQPDIRGDLMPKAVEGGQLVWFEETVGSLIGRAEVANRQAGVASSFSCPDPCQCPPSFSTAFLTPTSSVGPMGGTAQFQSKERRQDCHGVLYGPYDRTANSTWHSDNTPVFTVNGGTISCLNPGTGNVTAQFQGIVYTLNCFNNIVNPTVGGPVTVARITFQKSDGSALASPLQVGISATTLGGMTHDRTQHLRAVVEPSSEAANVTIKGSSKLQITNPNTSGGTITFDVVGLSQSTAHGDSSITAKMSGSTIATAAVEVIVPHNVSATHDTTGGGLVIANRVMDATTSPGFVCLSAGQVALSTIYVRFLSVTVCDQFGGLIGTLYQGAEVSEFNSCDSQFHTINQPLTSSSTYSDPDGAGVGTITVAAGSAQANSWPSQPRNPAPPGCNSGPVESIRVRVDGFELTPGIANRQWTLCGTGSSSTSPPVTLTISWP
jgi:hypothetical protein